MALLCRRAAGFEPREDAHRGFDHGVFVPLKLLYPDASVPVVVLSLLETMDAAAHLRMGRALAPLRQDGVLVVGSGATFHSMPAMRNTNFCDTASKHAENSQAKVQSQHCCCAWCCVASIPHTSGLHATSG
jgi:aromatic ring-opening dioxygenase catalytic subunit (LigB family)